MSLRFSVVAVVIFIGLGVSEGARAQAMRVIATVPEQGAVNVPESTRVTFKFSKTLPQFGTDFFRDFIWAPIDSTSIGLSGQDFDESNRLNLIFFTLQHTPSTDFTFIVNGVQASDGVLMDRPFVLNYTTASEAGERTITGTVAQGDRKLEVTIALRQRIEHLLRQTALEVNAQATSSKHAGNGSIQRRSIHLVQESDIELKRTVLLLLDDYTLREQDWNVHAAAVLSDDGTYEVTGVRAGTYWPIAVSFGEQDALTVEGYGFYDADGDLAPDPVEVQDADLSDISINIFPFAPSAAKANADLAASIAAQYAEDQSLIRVEVVEGASFGYAFEDGTASRWRYIYYSASKSQITNVVIDPINYSVSTIAGVGYTAAVMPANFIDSDQVVGIADANGGSQFRSQYQEPVRLNLAAGDLDLEVRPEASRAFWWVRYVSPAAVSPPQELTVFVDAESGEVMEVTEVANEPVVGLPARYTLAQNYPNPFNPETTVRFTLPEASAVRLTVYDLLGREVTRLLDARLPAGEHQTVWGGRDAAGRMLPSGTYLYRLDAGAFTQTRRMILLK